MTDEPDTVDGTVEEETFNWETEEYVLVPDEAEASIGQVLYDAGLLLAVNNAVLHQHGLALGAVVEDGKVKGLSLHRTDDPQGLWFDEELTIRARQKAMAAGITLSPEKRGCKG